MEQSLNTFTLTVDSDDVVDMRKMRVITNPPENIAPSEMLYTLVSVEADGSHTIEWSTNGTDFYELDSFEDVIRPAINEVIGIRFIKVTGGASEIRVTGVLL